MQPPSLQKIPVRKYPSTPLHLKLSAMAEYISNQACDKLLDYYIKVIAKTLAIAEVITDY